jgi:hypothetical protein
MSLFCSIADDSNCALSSSCFFWQREAATDYLAHTLPQDAKSDRLAARRRAKRDIDERRAAQFDDGVEAADEGTELLDEQLKVCLRAMKKRIVIMLGVKLYWGIDAARAWVSSWQPTRPGAPS